MDKGVHWLAGPIGYKQTLHGLHPDQTVQVCKWEFVGVSPAGNLRRFHLCFSVETRKFTVNSLAVTDWEKAHSSELADFYRPTAVLRSMLPKGNLADAMRAMLTTAHLAEVTSISIRGGKAGV